MSFADKVLDIKRKLKLSIEKSTFLEARRSCIKLDGDLIGREIKDDNVIAEMKSLLLNAYETQKRDLFFVR